VALLKLNRTLKYNNRVGPVCLPESGFPPRSNCFVTGWGTTEKNPQTPSQVRSSTKPGKVKKNKIRKRQEIENIDVILTRLMYIPSINRY